MRSLLVLAGLALVATAHARPPSGYQCAPGRSNPGVGCTCPITHVDKRDGENTAICAVRPPPPPPALPIAVRQVLDQAIAAKGGALRQSKLTALHLVAKGTVTAGGTPIAIELERWQLMPDRFRTALTLDVGGQQQRIAYAFKGTTGWQLGVDGKPRDSSAADVAATIAYQVHDPEWVLLRASDPGSRAKLAPDVAIDGKPHSVVRIESPVEIMLYIDKQTKLLTRMTWKEDGKLQTENYSDYRTVDGILIAHRRESSNGAETSKIEVIKVEVNPTFDPKLFDRPKS